MTYNVPLEKRLRLACEQAQRGQLPTVDLVALLKEAAASVEALRISCKVLEEEHASTSDLAIQLGEMLGKTVEAIRGAPPKNCGWSTHDVVELVTEMRRLLDDSPFAERMRADYRDFQRRTEERQEP